MLELKPGDTTSVSLMAHFYGPGTYDVNQFRFSIDVRPNNRSKEEMIAFQFPSLSYLVRVVENM